MLAEPGAAGVKLTEQDEDEPVPVRLQEILSKLPVDVPAAPKLTEPDGVTAVPAFPGLSVTVAVHVDA